MGFPKASRIENVFAQTILDSSYTDAELKIKVSATGSGKLTAKLLDEKKQEIASSDADIKSDGVTELSIQVKDPLKWTAESPNLYHLVVSTGDQVIAQRIGFRHEASQHQRHPHLPSTQRPTTIRSCRRDGLLGD